MISPIQVCDLDNSKEKKQFVCSKKTNFQRALNSIYTEDSDTFLLVLQEDPSILCQADGPWFLIHHLYDNYWEWGIQCYLKNGGSKCLLTKDFTTSLNKAPMFIIGGQTILHIAARNKDVEFDKLVEENLDLNIRDFNGNLPNDIRNRKYNLQTFQEQLKKVRILL